MTKKCPKCSKQMIKVGTGIAYASYPPQYPMKWWCKCGYEEEAGIVTGKTEEEVRLEQWERAQNGETGEVKEVQG